MTDTQPLTPPQGTPTTEAPTVENPTGANGEGTQPVVVHTEIAFNEDGTPKEPVTPPQPATPPIVPPVTTPAKKEETDYRKKFSESTRRNQIVESQFKELQKVLGDITKTEVPTDDEMVAITPDWEYLSDREKNAERKLVVLERRQNHIIGTLGNIASETENASKLDEFIASETRLAGKEEDFLAFIQRPANKGATMEVLLNAFLFEAKEEVTPPTPATPPTEEIPPSLERGNSSGNMPPVSTGAKEYSDEEIKVLRTQNPKKYFELIRKGQI